MKSELKDCMFEDRSSVSERLRALVEKWRTDAQVQRAAAQQTQPADAVWLERLLSLDFAFRQCADELDALLSAEVHASTGEGLRERVLAAETLLRSCMTDPGPRFDSSEYRVFRNSPALSSVADVLRDAAAALPSPPTPDAPLTHEKAPSSYVAPDPEPFLPEGECTTADMLLKIAQHLRVGNLVAVNGLDPMEWIEGLEDRAARIKAQWSSPVSTPPEQAGAPLDDGICPRCGHKNSVHFTACSWPEQAGARAVYIQRVRSTTAEIADRIGSAEIGQAGAGAAPTGNHDGD